MSPFRSAAALAVGVSLVVAGQAGAAAEKPKLVPVCNLITDDAGDASVVTAQDGMDILSGDLASNGKDLTAVIRLKGAPAQMNPQSASATDYYVSFVAPGSAAPQYLHATLPFTGAAVFATGQTTTIQGQSNNSDDSGSGATGSIKGNVVTISAPLTAFTRVTVKPGTKVTGLAASTWAEIGVPFPQPIGAVGVLQRVDDASGKDYTAGALSCVTPGKV